MEEIDPRLIGLKENAVPVEMTTTEAVVPGSETEAVADSETGKTMSAVTREIGIIGMVTGTNAETGIENDTEMASVIPLTDQDGEGRHR